MSIEQFIRDLLDAGRKEGLIPPINPDYFPWDPQELTAGAMSGLGNMLQTFVDEAVVARDARWQLAVGMPLEEAERQARALEE